MNILWFVSGSGQHFSCEEGSAVHKNLIAGGFTPCDNPNLPPKEEEPAPADGLDEKTFTQLKEIANARGLTVQVGTSAEALREILRALPPEGTDV